MSLIGIYLSTCIGVSTQAAPIVPKEIPTGAGQLIGAWDELSTLSRHCVAVPLGMGRAQMAILALATHGPGVVRWSFSGDRDRQPIFGRWLFPETIKYDLYRMGAEQENLSQRELEAALTPNNIAEAIYMYVKAYRLSQQYEVAMCRVLFAGSGRTKTVLLDIPRHVVDIFAGSLIPAPRREPDWLGDYLGDNPIRASLGAGVIAMSLWELIEWGMVNAESKRQGGSAIGLSNAPPTAWNMDGPSLLKKHLIGHWPPLQADLTLWGDHLGGLMPGLAEHIPIEWVQEIIGEPRRMRDTPVSVPTLVWWATQASSEDLACQILKGISYKGYVNGPTFGMMTGLELAKLSMLGLSNGRGNLPQTGPPYPLDDVVLIHPTQRVMESGYLLLDAFRTGPVRVTPLGIKYPGPGMLPARYLPPSLLGDTFLQTSRPVTKDDITYWAQEQDEQGDEAALGREEAISLAEEEPAEPRGGIEEGLTNMDQERQELPGLREVVTDDSVLLACRDRLGDQPDVWIGEVQGDGDCGALALAESAEKSGLGRLTRPEEWIHIAKEHGLKESADRGWWDDRVLIKLAKVAKVGLVVSLADRGLLTLAEGEHYLGLELDGDHYNPLSLKEVKTWRHGTRPLLPHDEYPVGFVGGVAGATEAAVTSTPSGAKPTRLGGRRLAHVVRGLLRKGYGIPIGRQDTWKNGNLLDSDPLTWAELAIGFRRWPYSPLRYLMSKQAIKISSDEGRLADMVPYLDSCSKVVRELVVTALAVPGGSHEEAERLISVVKLRPVLDPATGKDWNQSRLRERVLMSGYRIVMRGKKPDSGWYSQFDELWLNPKDKIPARQKLAIVHVLKVACHTINKAGWGTLCREISYMTLNRTQLLCHLLRALLCSEGGHPDMALVRGVSHLGDETMSQVAYIMAAGGYEGVEKLLSPKALDTRPVGEVDWHGEKEKRNTVRKRMAYLGKELTGDYVSDAVYRLLGPAAIGVKAGTTEAWWASRKCWAVSGAAPGYSAISKEERARATKVTAVETLGDDFPRLMLDKEPGGEIRPHTKRDELAAKLRAIYGLDVHFYLVADRVSSWIERFVGRVADVGGSLQKKATIYADLVAATRGSEAVLSFDYKDFNAQHRLEYIQGYYDGIKRVAKIALTGEDREDITACCDWLIKGWTNIIVHYPDDVGDGLWRQGLPSGVRDTTLINTILNTIYVGWITGNCGIGLGCEPRVAYCHGDDMVATFKDIGRALRWRSIAMEAGFEAQEAKCLTGERAAEYLRMLVTPRGLSGQLNRSIGSFVNGSWESRGEAEPAAEAQALVEQSRVLIQRGGNEEVVSRVTKVRGRNNPIMAGMKIKDWTELIVGGGRVQPTAPLDDTVKAHNVWLRPQRLHASEALVATVAEAAEELLGIRGVDRASVIRAGREHLIQSELGLGPASYVRTRPYK